MEANLSCRCGAKANFTGKDAYISAEVRNWRADHLNCSKLPITAPTSKIAFTKVDPSVVEESTPLTTLASLLSDPVDTKSGPVGHNSGCAHQWEITDTYLTRNPSNNWGRNWCSLCGALWWNGEIHVPGVGRISSTSVKQPSKESVENSIEESVKLRLNEWYPANMRLEARETTHYHQRHSHDGGERWHIHEDDKPNSFEEVCRVAVLQDSHCILKVGHPGPHTDSFGEHPAPKLNPDVRY